MLKSSIKKLNISKVFTNKKIAHHYMIVYNNDWHADVAELVDAPGLGPGGETHGGSSPLIRTKFILFILRELTNGIFQRKKKR